MILKSDAKFEEKPICRFKTDKNLVTKLMGKLLLRQIVVSGCRFPTAEIGSLFS